MFSRDSKIWYVLSCTAAIVMTIAYAVFLTNFIYNYIPIDSFLIPLLNSFILYGPMILCGVTAVSAFAKRGLVVQIIVIAIWVLIFLLSYFPETFYNLLAPLMGK